MMFSTRFGPGFPSRPLAPRSAVRYRRWLGGAVLSFAGLLCGCAEQRIRDASQTAFNAGSYEQSVQILREGRSHYPDSEVIRSSLVSTQAAALERLLESAQAAMERGKTDEAADAVKRALAIDPQSGRAAQIQARLDIWVRQEASLADAKALMEKKQPDAALQLVEQALKDDPRHRGLVGLKRQLQAQQRQQQLRNQAEQQLAESRPISLDFRDANLRTVLDLVSRNSGINFVLDKDIRSDARITVFVKRAKVEDVLDLIVSTNQLAKKVLDAHTIAIYPNTPEKQREYQEQVVRVFYLANAEAKGAATFLKAMLKIRDPFVDEQSNMLSLRDSPDNIALAERLLALYDTSEPEVVLEVEVLEVNTTKTLQAGISLPSSVGFSIDPVSSSTSSSGSSSGLTLANIRHLTKGDIAITVGSASVNLNRQMGDFTTLANPRIRVKNREKAKVLVGEKIPVISATTGQTGFVTSSVTYLDVGLKLDVEPTISVDNDVSIKMGLEVSTLGSAVQTTGGTLAYQISTRNATTVLRLHDGESQMLAGLINRSESHSSAGLPGLDSLPLLGRIFSNKTDTNNRTELVLVITPHIVRNIRPADASETELWVGTEARPRLRPVGGLAAVAAAPAEAPASANATGAARASSPAALPGPAVSPPLLEPNTVKLQWKAPPMAKVGDVVEVQLDQDATASLRGVALDIAFDRTRLQLVESIEGDYFKQGGAETSFSRSVDPTDAVMHIGVLRNQATTAVGSGTVMTLRFKALATGSAQVQVRAVRPVAMEANAFKPVALPSVAVDIR